MKRLLAASASAAIAVAGTTLLASPAQAAPALVGNLVAVNVSDVEVLNDVDVLRNSRILNNLLNDSLDDNNVGVGVAANIAAQVCADANVAAVLAAIRDDGGFACDAANEAGELIITQAN